MIIKWQLISVTKDNISFFSWLSSIQKWGFCFRKMSQSWTQWGKWVRPHSQGRLYCLWPFLTPHPAGTLIFCSQHFLVGRALDGITFIFVIYLPWWELEVLRKYLNPLHLLLPISQYPEHLELCLAHKVFSLGIYWKWRERWLLIKSNYLGRWN